MADQKTAADLRKAAEITDDEINAGVNAALAKPGTGSHPIGGFMLDLAAAVEAHEPARKALADEATRPGFRRTLARTAILLARPIRRKGIMAKAKKDETADEMTPPADLASRFMFALDERVSGHGIVGEALTQDGHRSAGPRRENHTPAYTQAEVWPRAPVRRCP